MTKKEDTLLNIGAALIGAVITTAMFFIAWKLGGSPEVTPSAAFALIAITAFMTDLMGKVKSD